MENPARTREAGPIGVDHIQNGIAQSGGRLAISAVTSTDICDHDERTGPRSSTRLSLAESLRLMAMLH